MLQRRTQEINTQAKRALRSSKNDGCQDPNLRTGTSRCFVSRHWGRPLLCYFVCISNRRLRPETGADAKYFGITDAGVDVVGATTPVSVALWLASGETPQRRGLHETTSTPTIALRRDDDGIPDSRPDKPVACFKKKTWRPQKNSPA